MKQDGVYLTDLNIHVHIIKDGIKITQPSEAYWDTITQRSKTLVDATKDYYNKVSHPKCSFSIDKKAEGRGKEVIAKLENLDSKLKSKDRDASMEAVKQLEDKLKSIL